MSFRVTGQTQVAAAIANLQSQTARQAKLTGQISSGRKLASAADDPAAFAAAARARASSQRLAGYTQTVSDATAELNGGVAALLDGNRLLARAGRIVTEAVNGDIDQTGQSALADELDSVFERLVDVANSSQDGRFLFGGTSDQAPPFAVVRDAQGTVTGVSYTGSGDRGAVQVGPGRTADTRYNGAAVFQGDAADAFAGLLAIRDALRNPSLSGPAKTDALNAAKATLQAAQSRVSGAVAEQSSALAGLEAVSARFADLKLTADARTGELEGTDYADAVLRMQEQDTVYQATLAVSARLLQPSLLDFVR